MSSCGQGMVTTVNLAVVTVAACLNRRLLFL